ncbi:hypothetical protein CC1G_14718 [Coprinopsis cinerea okayama7|uniref:Uncharacterized protein n=1 Tax=Coprinopsis cinerea (strain Okayama-7 / 130 / ATCC MYA-4618 / FGSC 9003) TaxID=240176 RepID=D6RN07_COPC7|nr:hypothetical protein CC1G_14718 [Coprinopsis cinerea okayama7\|eukprot:XP_002911289.1 hypothetical protein CC1G_14718 [Coprinopsis cinerea okayama7\
MQFYAADFPLEWIRCLFYPGQDKVVTSFWITLRARIPRDTWPTSFTRLALSPWPLAQVEAMTVYQKKLKQDLISDIFATPFPSLCTLDVEFEAAERLLLYLREDPALHSASSFLGTNLPHPRSRYSLRLPSLRELTIRISSVSGAPPTRLSYWKYMQDLSYVLTRRANIGCPLDLLRFLDCFTPSLRDRGELQGAAKRVEFWPHPSMRPSLYDEILESQMAELNED